MLILFYSSLHINLSEFVVNSLTSLQFERAMKARNSFIESTIKTNEQSSESGRLKNLKKLIKISLFHILFCNGPKSLCFIFLFSHFISYAQIRTSGKMGQNPKNRWVQNSVKANRTRVWTQNLSLSPFIIRLYVCLNVVSQGQKNPSPIKRLSFYQTRTKIETLKMFEFESRLELKLKRFSFNRISKQ